MREIRQIKAIGAALGIIVLAGVGGWGIRGDGPTIIITNATLGQTIDTIPFIQPDSAGNPDSTVVTAQGRVLVEHVSVATDTIFIKIGDEILPFQVGDTIK